MHKLKNDQAPVTIYMDEQIRELKIVCRAIDSEYFSEQYLKLKQKVNALLEEDQILLSTLESDLMQKLNIKGIKAAQTQVKFSFN